MPLALSPAVTPAARKPAAGGRGAGHSRGDSCDREAEGLGETEGEVGALDGGAGGALGEVVDGRDDDDAAEPLVDRDLQLHVVAADDGRRRAATGPRAARGRRARRRRPSPRPRARSAGSVPGTQPGRAGGEDAARHRREGRGERDRDRRSPAARERFCSISGVCRCTAADAVGRHRAHHLAAEQVRLERPCRRRTCRRPRRRRRRRARAGRRRSRAPARARCRSGSSPGTAMRRRAREPLALHRAGRPGELGQAVGPRAGIRRVVEGRPGRLGLEPEVGAAVDDDDRRRAAAPRARPSGRAAGRGRRRRGRPASSTVVGSSTRSASGTRCGWTPPSRSPALLAAVTAPTSNCGWASSSRRISPPA